MIIKQLEIDGGYIAWNESQNQKNLFAVGSFQQINSNQCVLSIFTFDTLDKNQFPICIGQIPIDLPIKCICWSSFNLEKFQNGLIFTGHDNGTVKIFDASEIIRRFNQQNDGYNNQSEQNFGLISEQNLYDTPVTSIKVNPFKPNLIAIGGQEVLVINIEKNLTEPDIFNPGSPNLHEQSQVCQVSWNKKVPHILASADQQGLVVVWDLKTNKPIFNFQNASCNECKHVGLDWSPEIPTQVGVAFDDNRSTALQIWDLRNPQGPVMLLEDQGSGNLGHQQGISSLTWSTADGKLVLTGGENLLICWNYQSGEQICSQSFNEKIVAVQWSKVPSIYSVTLESGAVMLCALTSSDESEYAPRWQQPLSGCCVSAAGDVVNFCEAGGALINLKKINEILQQKNKKRLDQQKYIQLQALFKDLQSIINDDNLSGFCDWKVNQLKNLDNLEADLWRILKGISAASSQTFDITNNSVQTELLSSLGFIKNDLIKKAEDYTGKTHRAKKEDEQSQPSSSSRSATASTAYSAANRQKKPNTQFCKIDDAEGFFDELAKSSIKQQEMINQQKTSNSGLIKRQQQTSGLEQQEVFANEQVSRNINWDAGVERIIKENLIVGNYEGAIDCAMKCGRTAEGLLIAYSQNKDLFESTMQSFFVASTDPFIKNVFNRFIEKKIQEQTQNYDLKNWRECAGLIVTTSHTFTEICSYMNELGKRFLEEKNDEDSAIACYTFSINFDKLTDIYFSRISKHRVRSHQRTTLLMEVVEKLILIQKILKKQQKNIKFERMLHEVAQVLVDYNQITLSYQLLLECGRKTTHNAVLADLLYNSNDFLKTFERPTFPFKMVTVKAQQINTQQQTFKQQQQRGQQNQIFGNKDMPIQPPINQQQTNVTGNFSNKQVNPLQNKIVAPPVQYKPLQGGIGNVPPPIGGPQNINKAFGQTNDNQFGPPPLVKQESEKKAQQQGNSPSTLNQPQRKEPPRNLYAPPPITQQPKNPTQQLEPFPPVNQDKQNIPSNKNYQQQQQQQFQQQNQLTQQSFEEQKTQPPLVNNQLNRKPVEVVKPIFPPQNNTRQTQQQQNQIVTPSQNMQLGGPQPGNKQQQIPPQQQNMQQQQQQQHQPLQQQQQQQQTYGNPPVLQGRFNNFNNQGNQFGIENLGLSPPKNIGPPMQANKQMAPQQKFGLNQGANNDQVSEDEIQYIQQVFESVIPRLQQIERNFKKQQELENNIRAIYKMLQAGTLQIQTAKNVVKLSQEIDQQDFQSALNTHQQITKLDWENNKIWLIPLKRILVGK